MTTRYASRTTFGAVVLALAAALVLSACTTTERRAGKGALAGAAGGAIIGGIAGGGSRSGHWRGGRRGDGCPDRGGDVAWRLPLPASRWIDLYRTVSAALMDQPRHLNPAAAVTVRDASCSNVSTS